MSAGNAQMRDQVREAIGLEWEAFEARHPKLAGVLDQDAVVERVSVQLADDPEYRRAMDEATAAGMTGAAIVQTVRSFVKDWMAGLFF
jgi:hypothetical protein